jgi:hypothetical protein
MTSISIPLANMLKNSWTLAVSVAINISMKFCFVSVNDPREPYLLDEPHNFNLAEVIDLLTWIPFIHDTDILYYRPLTPTLTR